MQFIKKLFSLGSKDAIVTPNKNRDDEYHSKINEIKLLHNNNLDTYLSKIKIINADISTSTNTYIQVYKGTYEYISNKVDECILNGILLTSIGHIGTCMNIFRQCKDCSYFFIKLVEIASSIKYEYISGFNSTPAINSFYFTKDNNIIEYNAVTVRILLERVKDDKMCMDILIKSYLDDKVTVKARMMLTCILSEIGCVPEIVEVIMGLPLCPELFTIIKKLISVTLPDDDYKKLDDILLYKFAKSDIKTRHNLYQYCTRNVINYNLVITIGALLIKDCNKFVTSVIYTTGKIEIISRLITALSNDTVRLILSKIDNDYTNKILNSIVILMLNKNVGDRNTFSEIINEIVYCDGISSELKAEIYANIGRKLYEREDIEILREIFQIINVCDSEFMKYIKTKLCDHPVYDMLMDMLIKLMENNNIINDFKGKWNLLLTEETIEKIMANPKINKDNILNMLDTYNILTNAENNNNFVLRNNIILTIENDQKTSNLKNELQNI